MDRDVGITVEELVELYVLLVSMTGFLDVSIDDIVGPKCRLTWSLVRRATRYRKVTATRFYLKLVLTIGFYSRGVSIRS